MVKLKSFSRLKNIFSRLNPLNSFDFGKISVDVIRPPTSDDLLQKIVKTFFDFEKVVLIGIYHLFNTKNVDKEYLTVLTKNLKLIEDLTEGEENEVHLSDNAKEEGKNSNIFVACHNHYFGAIVPSCEDILSTVIYNCQFTVISSENNLGIIYNNSNLIILENFRRELLLFDRYVEFRFSVDCVDELNLLDESAEDFEKKKLELFDQFVSRNNDKFVNEFNSRFNKYNIYELYIKI